MVMSIVCIHCRFRFTFLTRNIISNQFTYNNYILFFLQLNWCGSNSPYSTNRSSNSDATIMVVAQSIIKCATILDIASGTLPDGYYLFYGATISHLFSFSSSSFFVCFCPLPLPHPQTTETKNYTINCPLSPIGWYYVKNLFLFICSSGK